MNEEERKEFDDLKERIEYLEHNLKERVDYLEHACKEQTKLISKMSDTMYEIAKYIKENK